MSSGTVAGTGAYDVGLPVAEGFETASHLILDYLNREQPMGSWSVTRVENGRQTFLTVDDNRYGQRPGDGHPWADSYCVRMAAGRAPMVAPDAAAVPAYAEARINDTVPIAAYAGATITEPDGSLFGAICGIDPDRRPELAGLGPVLELLAGLLTVALAGDRALHLAESTSRNALTKATTDALTGLHNRHGWDDAIAVLDRDYEMYADPTVVVVVDLDNLKTVNDGPGGHAAGDRLLRTAAGVLRGSLRDRDFVARLGGDEFGIVLNGCPTDVAPTLAERIGEALDEVGASASIGWAPLVPGGGGAEAAIRTADQNMYAVKSRRRDRRRGPG